MTEFPLCIVTPRGERFRGNAVSVLMRTIVGDISIRARHADYTTAIEIGRVKITFADGTYKNAACTKGFVSVKNGEVSIITDAFEFSDQIDVERATHAKELAEQILAAHEEKPEDVSSNEVDLAEIKLKRALNRLSVAGK